MARSGRSSLAGGLVDIISGETFNLGAQADGRFFHFWCVSRWWPLNIHKPSAWTCRSRVSSSQLAQDWPLTQLVRVKVSGTPQTYCSWNLKLSASLGTHYSMHAHASPPPGGASDCPARGRDRVTEKLVTHPAPCLPKASRALSELFLLRFLWQKVKLGRGLQPSCWNNQAHRNHPWFNRVRLLGANNWYESTFTSPAISLSFFGLLKAAALEAPSTSVALKDPESASDDAVRHTGFRYWNYTHRAPELNWETVKRRRRWRKLSTSTYW